MSRNDLLMSEKCKLIEARYEELNKKFAEHATDPSIELKREFSNIEDVIEIIRIYNRAVESLIECQAILKDNNDEELVAIAKEELQELKDNIEKLNPDIKKALLPANPNDASNVILEIRAGTGGDEASLFAYELFRMYARYCETNKFKFEIMECSENGVGGYKEAVAAISGKNVYSLLKFESGTHRVQRVPATESSGRVHTSAVTIAVLPEPEDIDIKINDKDIRMDIYRAGGAGGQCVNTTDSAIRLTHLPTGLVVVQQDERSQRQNKEKAMRVLRARLFELERDKQHELIASDRKKQVGSGDRSEKIRTYNFPQDRITDHRINFTLYNVKAFLNGEIFNNMVEQLKIAEVEKYFSEEE